MAHLNVDYLRQLRNGAATGINFKNDTVSNYESYMYGKMVKKPFEINSEGAS